MQYVMCIRLGKHVLQAMQIFFFSSQALPRPEIKSSFVNERVNIKSKLVLPAVTMSDTGNITCIGSNEAGVNSSTTHLLVVGKRQDQTD